MTKAVLRYHASVSSMRVIALFLAAASLAPSAISDRAIRREAAAIGKIARSEPPLMALDTLLETAVAVLPYTPDVAKRLYAEARTHAKKHPDLAWNSRLVKIWMTLDPSGGEVALREVGSRPLESLMSYYRDDRERAVSIARELLGGEGIRPSTFTSAAETIVATYPAEAATLLERASRRQDLRADLAAICATVLDRLLRIAEKEPDRVRAAIRPLRALFEQKDFAADARTIVTTSFEMGGRKVETNDSVTTLVELVGLMENLMDPAAREVAQKALRTRRMNYRNAPRETANRSIAAETPLTEALAQAREWDPARERLGQFWRYIIAKPRTEEEARPMIAAFIEMALDAPPDNDPFWFTQALLNLDGRLGPPDKQWVLPPALRPVVFEAAARVGQRAARVPEQYSSLIAAMEREKARVPRDVPSAQARVRLARLRSDLQTRYDFQLPDLNGATRSLKAERGKIVVLNFWATWCGPCRAELPAFGRVYESLRNSGVEMFAITDEPPEHVRQFATNNPVPIPVLIDQQRRVFEHHRITGLPQTYVLDRSGRTLAHFDGEVSEETLRKAITGK
jgi:peroxiredoxin